MLVFKAYFKVFQKYKFTVILYTVILLLFAGINLQTSDNSTNFVASRPDVYVFNQDDSKLSELLYAYIEENATIKETAKQKDEAAREDAINDALFYREVNYVLTIPEGFGEDFLNGKNPEVVVKSTGDYQASYLEMQLERFLEVASVYQKTGVSEEELLEKVEDSLKQKAEVEMTTSLDTDALSRASFYYNFANYSLLAGCVYVIAIVLSSFRGECIRKRTTVSSMNYAALNRRLLLANGVFALVLWAFYVVISLVLIRDAMFSLHGLCFVLNSFVFALCALAIGFLIGNLTTNKEALNGIINVVALGSSFLCGSFVPVEWLPDGVMKVAHVLPSYWYIQNNEMIEKLESFSWENVKPLLVNGGVVVGFTVVFVVATNLVTKRRG